MGMQPAMEPYEIAGGLVCAWAFPMASEVRAFLPSGPAAAMERLESSRRGCFARVALC